MAQQSYVFDPARFRDMNTPVLLMLGGESPPFVKSGLARIQSALPNVRLAELPGQKHTAMDTAPDIFLREVLAFFTP